MDEYLKKYQTKSKDKHLKKVRERNLTIYDSEEERNVLKNNLTKGVRNECEYMNSDEDSDVPFIVTETNSNEIVELSKEHKRKLLEVLNKNVEHEEQSKKSNEKRKKKKSLMEVLKAGKERVEELKKDSSICKNTEKRKIHKDTDSSLKSFRMYKDKIEEPIKYDTKKKKKYSHRKSSSYDSRDSSNSNRRSRSPDSDLSLPRNTKYDDNEEDCVSDSNISDYRKRTNRRYKEIKSSSSESKDFSSETSIKKNEEHFISYRSVEDESVVEEMNKTIYRDKKGKIITREEWIEDQKSKMNKNKKQKVPKEQRELEWASGLVQKQMRKKIIKENERIIKKRDIVNYEYDSDYDMELKNRIRKEDPMSIYMNKKKEEEKPTCPHQTPYNRFNILAGYRWDGVIRGNGFEQKRLQALRLKQQQNQMMFMNNGIDS